MMSNRDKGRDAEPERLHRMAPQSASLTDGQTEPHRGESLVYDHTVSQQPLT